MREGLLLEAPLEGGEEGRCGDHWRVVQYTPAPRGAHPPRGWRACVKQRDLNALELPLGTRTYGLRTLAAQAALAEQRTTGRLG